MTSQDGDLVLFEVDGSQSVLFCKPRQEKNSEFLFPNHQDGWGGECLLLESMVTGFGNNGYNIHLLKKGLSICYYYFHLD